MEETAEGALKCLLDKSENQEIFTDLLMEIILDTFEVPQEIRKEVREYAMDKIEMPDRNEEFEDGMATNHVSMDVSFLHCLARDNEEAASRMVTECYDVDNANLLVERAARLRRIAGRLEQLEANPTAPAYMTMEVPCEEIPQSNGLAYVALPSPPGWNPQIYTVARATAAKELEEGTDYTVQRASESPRLPREELGLEEGPPAKSRGFSFRDMAAAVGVPVDDCDMKVGDSDVKALAECAACPQGHHLKDGPCRRDYCWCTCSKCKADCGES